MLGYVTKKRARDMGLTHSAKMFGVLPCYVSFEDDLPDGVDVEMRWYPLWYLEPVLLRVYPMIQSLKGQEAHFFFEITGEL